MNSFKLSLTAFLALSVVTSLTSAGTALVTSPRGAQTYSAGVTGTAAAGDLAHGAVTAGSPRSTAAASRTSTAGMDCCSAVLRPATTLSPRAGQSVGAPVEAPATGKNAVGVAVPGGRFRLFP